MKDFFDKFPACDICLDEVCNTDHKCNCSTCKSFNECPKRLSATIRITLKCTQSCSHCCFDCTPNSDVHMSIETSLKISKFIKNNGIYSLNIMGGEIFCNPNYKEILLNIIPVAQIVRIVSNGDWAANNDDFASFLKQFNNVYVSISKDEFHHNKYNEKAKEYLNKHNIRVFESDLNEKSENMVPIGRSIYSYGIYSMFGTYCSNPDKKYSFLIDEEGDIYKCGFGCWKYENIQNYLNGGFRKVFKEINTKFYNVFIPSCRSCIRSYQNTIKKPTI